MTWFFIALLSPLFWAISNHLDKYLISKYFRDGGVGALMIFSAIIGLFVLPVIYFIEPGSVHIPFYYAIILGLSGCMYAFGFLPYFYAISKNDASVVVPLFQLIPVFSYFLGLIFLQEYLTFLQVVAALFIIIGAVLITIDFGEQVKRFNVKVFLLMSLSSLIFALNGLIFKMIAVKQDFWITSFWEYVGLSILAIVLFVFVRPYRRQFLLVIKSNKIAVLSLNGFNEVINIIAKMIMNFASILAPLALVWTVNAFQPIFVLVIGILLAVTFPHLTGENLNKKHIFQKSISMAIMFVGAYLLSN